MNSSNQKKPYENQIPDKKESNKINIKFKKELEKEYLECLKKNNNSHVICKELYEIFDRADL